MDIEILEIKGRGDVATEEVVFRVLNDCNLKSYILIDSTYDDGELSNKNRHVFILPDENVRAGNKFSVFTRSSSKSMIAQMIDKDIYMGLDDSIWNKGGDVATLIKIADQKDLKLNKNK